jgi:hypothetical protein
MEIKYSVTNNSWTPLKWNYNDCNSNKWNAACIYLNLPYKNTCMCTHNWTIKSDTLRKMETSISYSLKTENSYIYCMKEVNWWKKAFPESRHILLFLSFLIWPLSIGCDFQTASALITATHITFNCQRSEVQFVLLCTKLFILFKLSKNISYYSLAVNCIKPYSI